LNVEPRDAPETKAPPVSRSEKRLEIAATFLLAIAAIATAWSGFQAALWDGRQSSNYTQASAARTEASENHLEANQDRIIDLDLFENFLNAQATGDSNLADFYKSRFRDEFRPAFDAWTALQPLTNSNAPRSPLQMPEYQPAGEAKAKDLNAQAEAKFQYGENANSISDTYVATTLFFASVLFFAAISERFEFFRARIILLALASASLVTGIAVMVSQKVTWS
jgi:ABC-type multidrug transport system permease subunit